MMLALLQHAPRVVAPMPDEMKLAVTVGATLLLAMIGVVFYLGRKIGAFGERVKSFEETTKAATLAGEKWNADLLAALREVDERITDACMRISDLEHKWREAHGIIDRVNELEQWRGKVDTRCEERRMAQCSRPNLFEAPDDDGGGK